jgi:undecaprenyl diphosphate synthase|tara:strand:- start:6537 stop:7244 length:708 start_codon:yes stop_codon:yes gene_type:complete
MKSSPNHVAIIMDGNTRWAKKRGLPSKEGHKEGVKKAREAVEFSLENDIKYLTLFAFSTENWLRDEIEVSDLISLFFDALEEQTPKLIDENVKLSFIGDISRFNKKLINQIKKSSMATQDYDPELNLIIAASYGGKWDILNAMNNFMLKHKIDKKNKKITEKDLENNLETKDFPNPDLIIRTGGEIRLSNFYLWQASYAELYFSKKYWPDFKKKDFKIAIDDFNKRKRKFGIETG